MTPLLLALAIFSTPAGDFRFYDRAPRNRQATRFFGEDMSRALFAMKLLQLGVKEPTLDEPIWMLDGPYAKPARGCAPTCESASWGELHEIPQGDLYPADRGVWRSYLLVVRKGGWAVPDSHVAVVTRDSCVTLDLEKRR